MELNDRQRQELSTAMETCRNIAYPSLGLIEEVGEYVQKLIYLVRWNPNFPAQERDRLTMLLQGIATNALAIGRLNKEVRHGTYPRPFALKTPESVEFPELLHERIEGLQKELGDIHWMLDAAHFYTVHPDLTDPTLPDTPMTAQSMADQNYAKLAERRLHNTIDGQGDNERTSV